jgi:myo-inositol 2-dehydrogenase/D-chiro-inositol 1-dehydrogenase
MNRRYFFGTALGALAARRVRAVPPSDQVNVAIIGVGGRGRALIGDFAKVPGANVRYLVDADQASLEKAAAVIKKLGLAAPQTAVDMRRPGG